MNIHEKRKTFEKLLAGPPEVMSPMQASKGTPYGRDTIYAMLRLGELLYMHKADKGHSDVARALGYRHDRKHL